MPRKKKMKRSFAGFLLVVISIASIACSTSGQASSEGVNSDPSTILEESTTVEDSNIFGEFDARITLNGDTISVEGSGVSASGSSATISEAGIYQVSGTLNNGQIIVDSISEGTAELVLAGAALTNHSSAPIYIKNADEVVITLAEGSQNSVTDGETYAFPDAETDEPDAAIFSESDLTFQGSGSLTINANYKNGIYSKDDLNLEGGVITVNAVSDGVKGRDSVEVKAGTLTITAGGDGIQASNDSDVDKGFVGIEGGTVSISSDLDGIQAATNLTISAGSLTIVSGGGSANSSAQAGWGQPGGGMNKPDAAQETAVLESMKGLKAGTAIMISGGEIAIDSADDAFNSNDSISIAGGQIAISSGDDGLYADTALTINNGSLTITQSYEGLESAAVAIHGGDIHITSSDDAINVAGGNDGSAANGRPGQNEFSTSANYLLTITGGSLVVDAGGDGLDANGSIEMSGGQVIVNGPTNDGNGALDYLGTFNITGGFIVAVGSSGMAQAASESSNQYSVLYNFDATQSAGTLVSIATQDGQNVLTFAPAKDYQSVLFSSAELENGVTYNLYSGGSASGSSTDGLYADGAYTPGSTVTSFPISSLVTRLGAAGNTMGGGQGGRGGRPGGGGGNGMQPPG